MKIYREVMIESAEQAEALPEGSVAMHEDHWPFEKYQGVWQAEDHVYSNADLIGWTTYEPIEVEEHTETRRGWLVRSLGGVNLQLPYQGRPEDSLTDGEEPQEYTLTRWTTEWEEA